MPHGAQSVRPGVVGQVHAGEHREVTRRTRNIGEAADRHGDLSPPVCQRHGQPVPVHQHRAQGAHQGEHGRQTQS